MKKFLDEFKQFISKGNVVDLAVGVIIGGAFSKIVYMRRKLSPPRNSLLP